MDENQINIRYFESVLQRHSIKTSAGIYGDGSNQKNSPSNRYTPKDVLTNVAQTIRSIQNADCVKLDRNARKKLALYKNSQFLTVDMLPISKEEPKPPVQTTNRFETQCVTDTQLIDVIDKAEGLNVEVGMTQEFDTTFFLHEGADSGDGDTKGSGSNINKNLEVTGKVLNSNAKENVGKHTNELITNETVLCHKSESNIQKTIDIEYPGTSHINETVHNTEKPKDQPVLLARSKTELLNESIEIELSLENVGVVIEDTERAASPVLKTYMQTKKPIVSQHNIVVDLEQFEKFEKFAAQLLISEDVNLNAAKNLINSQILGKEITLLPEFDKQCLEREQNISALETEQLNNEYQVAEKCVIEDELQVSQILISRGKVSPIFNTTINVRENPNEKSVPQDKSKLNKSEDFSEIEHITEIQSSTTPVLRPTSVASEDKLEDEILFSSDEEGDIHKEVQEIPLSIALETSFYTNQSDILDRTMYVGFQTASNKSIQISVDSYAKARNAFEVVSMKELVEKCSENVHVQFGKHTAEVVMKDAEEQGMNKISDENENIGKNLGFKTASGKNIAISEEAMIKTNTYFHDLNIELPEVFENISDIQVLPDISENKINNVYTLEKFKDIFKDIDLSDIFDTEMRTVEYYEKVKELAPISECPPFKGFKTASNKNINISKKALDKSRKVFQDIDEMDNKCVAKVINHNNDTLTSDTKSPTVFVPLHKTTMTKEEDFKGNLKGLRRLAVTTASNKQNQFSGEALSPLDVFPEYIDIEEIHQDVALLEEFKTDCPEIATKTESKEKIEKELLETVQNPAFFGFKTASDKQIDISKQAMATTMEILKDIDSVNTTSPKDITVQSKSMEFGVSKTSSNKLINISSDPLAKTKSHINDHNYQSENGATNQDVPVFKGFQTGSKKPVIVSKEALAKTNRVFQDIDNFSTLSSVEYVEDNTAPTFVGFQTVSKKPVVISEEALDKTEEMFQDIDKMAVDNPGPYIDPGFQTANLKPVAKTEEALEKTKYTLFQDIDQDKKPLESVPIFKGDQTASKKPVSISKEALEKTKNIFQDIDQVKMPNVDQNQKFEPTFIGFQTASKKPVSISKEALEKTKCIFQDIDQVELLTDDKPTFIGFQTASKKPVPISKEALEKTKNIFQDIDQVKMPNVDQNQKFEPTFIGFQTASKKPVSISKEALEKTKCIFQDIDQVELLTDDKPTFIGFQTASKKPVPISKEALEKTKNIFQDIDQVKMPNVDQNQKFEPTFIGFQTASKKPVSISKEALGKTKCIFQDIDQVELLTDDKPTFIGFQTASKKPVPISKEALEKTKNIFQDIDQVKMPNVDQNQKFEPTFIGFQTASKKPVSISKEALEKTKCIFQDIDQVELLTDDKPTFIGFQTASKKSVPISKEALEKTKNIFQDIHQVKMPNIDQNQKFEPTFIGFQTASKKPVSISKESLEKTKNIFQDIDQVKMPNDDQNQKFDPTFIGFQTANKKPVSISKEALEKTKNIFQGLNESNEILTEVVKPRSEPQFVSFQTASNKSISVSKEALKKTKSLFEDIHKDDGIEQFQDIVRPCNKDVEICKKAIEKTTTLFEKLAECSGDSKVNQDYLTRTDNTAVKTDNSNFCGFQTASNKAVKISAEALAKSRNIFQDIDLDDKVKKFENFQTPTTNEITISGDTLVSKPKNIFDNIESNEVISANFLGFQTASKKKVEISEDALAKTKDIFKDIELTQMAHPHLKNNYTQKSNEESYQNKNALPNIANVKRVNTNSPPKNLVYPNVKEIEVDNIIDTQVLHNFEEPLNTEDFCPKSPEINRKRPGSPILSCPKAKKRKCFKTPYKITSKIDKPVEESSKSIAKPNNPLKFDVNYKKQKYYTLIIIQELENDSKEKAYIDPQMTSYKFDGLLQFQFTGGRNNLTTKEILSVGDLKILFEESVNSKIIPNGWFENHLKLILWKLISYEVKFPRTMSNTCNAKTVIDQLKYRYDRELYRVERPALRKILERDDVSTRTIVLCVVSIFADGDNVPSVTNPNSTVELLLTDGWYCVQACTDKMLARLVCERKIFVGCKLMTHGAELLNCEQGIAPWEDTSKVRLKLAGNSTRRAAWDAPLGYHGNAAILSPLPTVCADGGKVAKTRVFVARVYPLLYVEKFEDGSTVTRSERLEQIYQMKYEADRQIQLERFYEDIEKEFSDVESQESDPDLGSGKRRCLDSGSQIAKLMRRSKDPQEFRSTLTDSQHRLLDDHTTKTRERLLQDIQARVQERLVQSGLNMPRNVVSLLKIRVAGAWEKRGELVVTKGPVRNFSPNGCSENICYKKMELYAMMAENHIPKGCQCLSVARLMSIWRPNDAILEILQEGAWIDVMDVVPTALRYSELQLSAGRQSTFDKAKVKETEKTKALAKSLARTCSNIKDLTRNPNSKHDYNEIDTVGMVFEIEPNKIEFEKESIKNHHQFQNVYITDAEKNLLCINFWGGLKKFGFENILDTGQVIVGTNLQKRAGNTRKNIPQFRATEFTYFTKTPRNQTARDMVEEMVKKFQGLDRRKFCQDCIEKKNNMASIKYQSNTENISPYRFNNSDYNLSRNRIYIESPLVQKPLQRKDEDLNLTGLDFESTFKHKDTQDLSPEELKRKQRVQQKMAKLRMYGEPPPISPIHIINKSVNACNEYKSPLLTKLPQERPKTTLYDRNYQNHVGVASLPNENQQGSVERCFTDITSPMIVMNRTYVKNVNPVKLNFSNNDGCEENNACVDHFAEEFDDSPPLSLD